MNGFVLPGPGSLLVPPHLIYAFFDCGALTSSSSSSQPSARPAAVSTSAFTFKYAKPSRSTAFPCGFDEGGLQGLDPTPWPDAHRIVAAAASAIAIYRALVDFGYVVVRGAADSACIASTAEVAAMRCFHHDSDAWLERSEVSLGGTADQTVGYRRQGAREYFQLSNLHVMPSGEGEALLASAMPSRPRKATAATPASDVVGATTAADLASKPLPMLTRIFSQHLRHHDDAATSKSAGAGEAGAAGDAEAVSEASADTPFPHPPVRTDADAAAVCAAFTAAYDSQDRLARLLLRFVTLGAALHAYGCAGCQCERENVEGTAEGKVEGKDKTSPVTAASPGIASDSGATDESAAPAAVPSPSLPAWAARALLFSSGIASFMVAVESMLDHVPPPWRVRAEAMEASTRAASAAAGAESLTAGGSSPRAERAGAAPTGTASEALAAAACAAAAAAAAEPSLEPEVASHVPAPPPGAAHVGPDVFRVYSYWRPPHAPLPGFRDAATGLHADMGLLTVAPRASLPGLVLLQPRSGAWGDVEAPLARGDFTAFLGEALPRVLAPLMAIARAHAAHVDSDVDAAAARPAEGAAAAGTVAGPGAESSAVKPPPPVACSACAAAYGPAAAPFELPRAPLHWVDERRMGWPRVSMPFFLRARPAARIPAFPDAAAAAAAAAGLPPEAAASLSADDTQLWQPLSSAAFDLHLRRTRPWRVRAAQASKAAAPGIRGAASDSSLSPAMEPAGPSSVMSGGT